MKLIDNEMSAVDSLPLPEVTSDGDYRSWGVEKRKSFQPVVSDEECCEKKTSKMDCTMKSCATPSISLALLSFANVWQGFLVSGLYGVVVSTLEKRFDLQSTETGFIASCYDIASLLVVLTISYVGGKGRKPLWIAWGNILMGVACVCFSLPHFLAPPYTNKVENDCVAGAEEERKCQSSNLRSYKYLFIVCWLLCGAGGTPLSTLGISYLDENVKQVKSSLYTGIYYACAAVGPALGYLIGGQFLSIYTDITKSVEMSPGDPLWIGAWWIGYLVGGVSIIISSVPIFFLPNHLPNTDETRMNRDVEVHQKKVLSKMGDRKETVLSEIYSICSNPTFVLVVLAGAAEMAMMNACIVFGSKFMTNIFGYSKHQSAMVFGCITVVSGALGLFAGGAVVTKAKLTVKGILKFVIVASACSVATTTMFLFTCPEKDLAGATVGYLGSSTTYLSSNNDGGNTNNNFSYPCNSQCYCRTDVFTPICGSDGITYYSPCFAGCHLQDSKPDSENFWNCTCIPPPSTAVAGKCPPDGQCTQNAIYFLAVFFTLLFCTLMMQTPAVQVVLRVIPFSKRPLAIGVKFILVRILGSIPGPILYGHFLDKTCIVWNTECGETGSCKLYNNQLLSQNFFWLCFAIKLIALLLFIAALFVYKKPTKNNAFSTSKETPQGSNQDILKHDIIDDHIPIIKDCKDLYELDSNDISNTGTRQSLL